MPGTESNSDSRLGCSFRTQQGANHFLSAAPAAAFPSKIALCVLRLPAVANIKLASVSACEHPTTTVGQYGLLAAFRLKVLLRKEVIQPHLPVRLPCYDFVPIASPTFDGSLHKGWATGFGCCRLS